jgi:ClpP class serine protease
MTQGGILSPDYQQIAHALKNHPAKAPAIAPQYAMSGAA